MSPQNVKRLTRIEVRMDEVLPGRSLGIAERLTAAREAFADRAARGEPEPPWTPMSIDPHSSWEGQRLRQRLNDARVRTAAP